MEIKICGITSLDEIEYINKLRPEYIGFVFTKSKRKITVRQGKVLSERLSKEVKSVGVFKNNSLKEIIAIIKEIKLDIIQLHGNEDNDFIENLRKIAKDEYCERSMQETKEDSSKNFSQEIKIWKGVAIKSEEDLKRNINLRVDNFVLDGGNPGSGEIFNWNLIKKMNRKLSFFLAGGVNLENIDEIIRTIKPYGVDISSGVEGLDKLGNRKKDLYKMKTLIEKVRKEI